VTGFINLTSHAQYLKEQDSTFGYNCENCIPIRNSLTGRFTRKLSMYRWQRFPSHVNCVVELPCETWKFKTTTELLQL